MQEEIWKDIPGFEGRYQVSTFGRIKSLPRKVKAGRTYRYVQEHILSARYDSRGYSRICIKIHPKKYWFSVHRLVAEIFIPNPNNYPVINHKDNNPRNNCVDNLEWCTQSYNVKYSYTKGNAKPTSGCFKKGNIPHNLKRVSQYDKDGHFLNFYDSITLASKSIKRTPGAIQNCLHGNTKTAGGYVWRYAD